MPRFSYDELIALSDRVLAATERPAHLMDEPEVERVLVELDEPVVRMLLDKGGRRALRNIVQSVMDNIASRY